MTVKPGELRAAWSRAEQDIEAQWGGEGACSADGGLLLHALTMTPTPGGRTLRGELERRGYDISTLKFSIRQRKART